MSDHEHERLSAYLDGELTPDQMAVVRAHVATCTECAARLAEFAAVDEAATALAATAPSGYFEALPHRMRARLEPPALKARRLPAWTWAAAAALLLAVVTPLTLKERLATETATPTREREAPAAGPPATLNAPAFSQTVPSAAPEAPPAKLQQAAPPPPVATAATPVPPRQGSNAAAASEKREQGFAAAPAEADRVSAEPAPEGRRDAAPAPLRSAPGALSARVEPQAVPARDAAATADEESAQKRARQPDTAVPEPKAADTLADAQAQGAPAAKALPERLAVGSAGGYAETGAASDEDWRRLLATRPRTAEEWRRLREELRRFADAAPEGPHADAARLRTIEAGYAAWRSGGDDADEAVFRRDAAAYLERGEDAKNKARVRGLLH